MTAHFRHNRRWLGWTVALAMLALSASAGAAWQCTGGSACPAGSWMAAAMQAPGRQAPAPVSAAAPSHACCHPQQAASTAANAAPQSIGRSSCCVLQAQPSPDVSTQATTTVLVGPPALLTPPLPAALFLASPATASIATSDPLVRSSVPGLTAPRAPPFRVS